MSDIKLFALGGDGARELMGSAAKLEKDLQAQIEENMEALLGVRFLKSEHSTGNSHKGRIDSLGLDENNCPVIIEYKRDQSSTVINQGLFYLDWLQKNPADFKWLVMEKLGRDLADEIEWNSARLLCIAADFPKYDLYAVEQINANIELIRYRYFGSELLLLELVNAQTSSPLTPVKEGKPLEASSSRLSSSHLGSSHINATNISSGDLRGKNDLVSEVERSQIKAQSQAHIQSQAAKADTRRDTHQDRKAQATPEHLALYDTVCDFAFSQGDEVQRKELKFYTAFKSIKSFVSVLLWAPIRDPHIKIFLKLQPNEIELETGFSHDVSNKGHWGTGDVEVIIRNQADLEKAKALIIQSYERG